MWNPTVKGSTGINKMTLDEKSAVDLINTLCQYTNKPFAKITNDLDKKISNVATVSQMPGGYFSSKSAILDAFKDKISPLFQMKPDDLSKSSLQFTSALSTKIDVLVAKAKRYEDLHAMPNSTKVIIANAVAWGLYGVAYFFGLFSSKEESYSIPNPFASSSNSYTNYLDPMMVPGAMTLASLIKYAYHIRLERKEEIAKTGKEVRLAAHEVFMELNPELKIKKTS